MPNHTPIPFPLFALLFPLFLVAIVFALSFGGWQQFAVQYRVAAVPVEANRHFLGWAKIGWTTYQNVIRAGACSDGLVLTVFFLFRLFHPPLLIPWALIQTVEVSKGFWSTTYRLTIPTRDAEQVLQFKSASFLAQLRPWLRVVEVKA